MTGPELAPAKERPAHGSTHRPGAHSHATPAAPGDLARATVIVLTYAYSGAERLWPLLAAHPDLACTSGTGMLPLCERAATTWRKMEGRADGVPSPLATASIRAMASSAIITILARTGRRRWCEFATAPALCAETFLNLYPQTRFLCLHRTPAAVINEAIRSPELPGPALAPFAADYPGNPAATLAAYWTAHTQALTAFQESHPGACHRIRYEDLVANPTTAANDIFAFLGLYPPRAAQPAGTGFSIIKAAQAGAADPPAASTLEHLPMPLLAQVKELMKTLAYLP